MSKNVTRNVRIIGLEVRDLSPGTVVHKAGTHPQLRGSSFSRSCFSKPLLHNVLTSWCLYVTSFEALFVFSFAEIICEGGCFLHATSFEDIRCFRMCHVTCRNFTLLAEKSVSCYVTTTVFLRYIYPSIIFIRNLCSSVGDETCEQTRTISLFRAFTFCISQECMQVKRI